MPLHRDRRTTPQSAKRGPPCGLPQEAQRAAPRRLHGQPARAARRSLPENFLRQSRWFKLTSSCSSARDREHVRAVHCK